jgi:DNA-binding NarL/FixJ family response regulator
MTETATIRVLLVDDHEAMRMCLRMILRGEDDLEVVGEAGTGAEALKQARRLEPDVVLMDVRLPDGSGVDFTRTLKDQQPEVQVVGLSMHDEQQVRDSMVSAGAANYIVKSRANEQMPEIIRQATLDSAAD